MYSNVLLLYCRRTMRLRPQQVADLLGMTCSEYQDLENGNALLHAADARKLATLYNSKPNFFNEAAHQLDVLLSSRLMIQILQADNDRLRASIERLKSQPDGEEKPDPSEPPSSDADRYA